MTKSQMEGSDFAYVQETNRCANKWKRKPTGMALGRWFIQQKSFSEAEDLSVKRIPFWVIASQSNNINPPNI